MLEVIVVSDSTGETANTLANSIMVQFSGLDYKKTIYPNIASSFEVDKIFTSIQDKALIIMTVVLEDVAEKIRQYCLEKDIELIDLLASPVSKIEVMTGHKALRQPGLMRGINNDYLNKMEAIEFALKYDDGKNPKGFLLSDIVLVGVSRTSKTPLSIYLANKNYRVSNLPLLPEVELPKEIFEVDKDKIIGLIIDEDILEGIRTSRLKVLGLGSDSVYAKSLRIKNELEYARKVFEKLSCRVINVSGFTIEAIGTEIINHIEDLKSNLEDKWALFPKIKLID